MLTENQRGEPEPRRTIASSRERQGNVRAPGNHPCVGVVARRAHPRVHPCEVIRPRRRLRGGPNAANSSSLFVFVHLERGHLADFATMTLPSSSISSPAALSRRRGAANAVAAAGFADLAAAATSSARAKAVLRAASAPDGRRRGWRASGRSRAWRRALFASEHRLGLGERVHVGEGGLGGRGGRRPRGVRGRDRGGRRRGRREGVPVVPSSAFRAAGLGGGHLSGLRLLARALLRGARRRHLDEAANDRFSLRSTNLREIAARGDRARRRDGSRDRRRPRSTPRHARERRDARFEPRGVTATAARASLPLEGERRLEMPRRVFSSSNPGSTRAAATAGGLRRADRPSARTSLVEN